MIKNSPESNEYPDVFRFRKSPWVTKTSAKYLNLIGQSKYSYQILTKQRRCWKVVKIGHQELILTTSLKASGRS